jgi:serine/threonine protein kinase/tetratricopeptide (TPR) repeat protein
MQMDSEGIEQIFGEAIAKPNLAARELYLDGACGNDKQLRQRIDDLLGAHDSTANFLKLPEADPAFSASISEGPGTKIGRYKLLEQIGEGGFGVVFMAEQEQPVRRHVALKIIKLGMDTREVVARFEAERQALAMMEHTNIAKVFDAGSTDAGRPYFVMELIRGVPITNYCDQNALSVERRLHLFLLVCQAVQHAHQKGIIHRDLKPTNVLVTPHDDKAVPKIIDFGVAKATEGKLTDKTLFTGFRQLVGTPTYMSPEQAQLSGIDIDTRSDIYSLGVLLYELLTGTTPFDAKQLLSSSFEEIQRTIREVEPPPPSTRLSTLAVDIQTAKANERSSDPKHLNQQLRGDLDWIIMRCLEKDRTRRYETATGLAEDIQRYLTDQPVEARRPTKWYRLNKFIRRNKVGVLAGSAILATLLLGLMLASVGFIRASRQEQIARTQAARSEQVAQFLQDMLKAAGPGVARGRDATLLREILEQTATRLEKDLADQPEVQGDLWFTLGNTYREIGDYPNSVSMLQHAVDNYRTGLGQNSSKTAVALSHLGRCQSFVGDVPTGKKNTQLAVAIARKLNDPDALAACMLDAGRAFEANGTTTSEGAPFLREAVAIWKKTGSDPASLADCMENLATMSTDHAAAESESLAREALSIHRQHFRSDDQRVANSLYVLGEVLLEEDKLAEAESTFHQAYDLYGKIYDARHPYRLDILHDYSCALAKQGKFNEANSLIQKELKTSPLNANYWHELGRFNAARGDREQAIDSLTHAVSLNPNDEFCSYSLAMSLLQSGQEDTYRRVCHDYLDRVAARSDFGSGIDMTIASLLLPVDGADFDEACQFADDYGASSPTVFWFPHVGLCKSLAELRRSHFESAIEWANRLTGSKLTNPYYQASAWFIQAVADTSLQRTEDARTAIANGDEKVKTRLETDHRAVYDTNWEGRAIADHLRQEAATLIGQPSPAHKP